MILNFTLTPPAIVLDATATSLIAIIIRKAGKRRNGLLGATPALASDRLLEPIGFRHWSNILAGLAFSLVGRIRAAQFVGL
jgi:hypothetical protein